MEKFVCFLIEPPIFPMGSPPYPFTLTLPPSFPSHLRTPFSEETPPFSPRKFLLFWSLAKTAPVFPFHVFLPLSGGKSFNHALLWGFLSFCFLRWNETQTHPCGISPCFILNLFFNYFPFPFHYLFLHAQRSFVFLAQLVLPHFFRAFF